MIEREKLLKSAKNTEDRLFYSKLLDRVLAVQKRGFTAYYGFLDPRQQTLLKALTEQLPVCISLYGGYDGSERNFAAFYETTEPTAYDYPIGILEVKARELRRLSHRDFLGSLMGLGIKREKVGDILISDTAKIIVSDDMIDFVKLNLDKVGNQKVFVDAFYGELNPPEKREKIIRDTVPSLRLDCIVSTAFGISRSNAAKIIKQERVAVNHQFVNDISYLLKGGETLSAKGFGKAEFSEISGKSKKDRYIIVIKKFL